MEIFQEPVLKVFQCCPLLIWFIIACVGTRAYNLDYGVVYIPSNTLVEFWNYPPSFPRPYHKFLCRSFANLSICLFKAEHNRLVIPDNSSGVLSAISLQHRQSRLFWDEASSRWRNSCRFRTALSLRHFIVRRVSSSRCTLSPWAHLTLPTKWAFWFPTQISIFSSRLLELFCVWKIAKPFSVYFPKWFTSKFAKSIDRLATNFEFLLRFLAYSYFLIWFNVFSCKI